MIFLKENDAKVLIIRSTVRVELTYCGPRYPLVLAYKLHHQVKLQNPFTKRDAFFLLTVLRKFVTAFDCFTCRLLSLE